MFRSPLNNVIVKITPKWIGNYTKIMKIAAIQNNTSVEPADLVNLVGTVVSAPLEISTWLREYKGFSAVDIKPGDTAILSHQVVFDFMPGGPEDEPVYKNSFWYKGAEYWNADITKVYAVIRDGLIRMQNGYVMVEKMEKPPAIYLPQHIKKTINTAYATVAHVGKPLTHQKRIDVERGDVVYFNPNIIRLHQINDKPFGILRQNQILGKKVAGYEELAALN